jgi:RimJ/RimL family protein N-acetyltransferase
VISLESERVSLRPLQPHELETVWEARLNDDTAPWMSTPQAYERLKQRVANSGRFVDGWLDLGIESEGRLVGEIDARQPPRSMPQGVYELGISLFETDDRGRGLGTDAVRLLTQYLFQHEEADRVQASTWVENRPMRRVFEKLGFAEEGVLRSYMPSERGRDDYVMYAITKSDVGEAGL